MPASWRPGTTERRPAPPGSGCWLRLVLPLAVAALSWPAQGHAGAGAAGLEITPRPALESLPGGPAVEPGPGEVIVFGLFEHPGFEVENPLDFRLESPAGRPLRALVEEESVFREFGMVVGFRLAFTVSESQATEGAIFTLEWGGEARGEHELVSRLSIDPGLQSRSRGFQVAPAVADREGSRDMPGASIQVVADSTADYHFAWYLLPVAVLFIILSIRKARDPERDR